MKHTWLQYALTFFFLSTVALELYACATNGYKISDFILENVRMKWRVAILAWLIYHFLFEFPTYK